MREIVEIAGDELAALLASFRDTPIYSLRVTVDDGAFKFKINGGIWSPPFGRLDPDCEAARPTRGAARYDRRYDITDRWYPR